MSRSQRPALQRAVFGLAAGIAAAFVMNLFSRAATAAGGGKEAQGAAPGVDRHGRGVSLGAGCGLISSELV